MEPMITVPITVEISLTREDIELAKRITAELEEWPPSERTEAQWRMIHDHIEDLIHGASDWVAAVAEFQLPPVQASPDVVE